MQTLTINRPDDWHVHLRDGLILRDTVKASAQHFARALIMPNLKPALTSIADLISYRERILQALEQPSDFTPYMTFYLNEKVHPDELSACKQHPYILGAKLYPAGATTNSEEGTHSLKTIYPLIDIMQQENLVLQIHGEMAEGDIFQREANFIETCLAPLIKNFPKLRIVLEHISTKIAVDFIKQAPDNVAATVTPHHLLYNRNHLLAGGIKPHYYCLPILKREDDQRALLEATTSQNPKFFAGTDSAPHSRANKESACGCAGIYSAPYALAMYAQSFDACGQLDKLNSFMSHFGAMFYQLPINQTELVLKKSPQPIPLTLPLGDDEVVPMAAGETLQWSIHEFA